MIKENQRLLNIVNVLLDGVLILVSVLLSFYIRFYVMKGHISEPISSYLLLAAFDIPVQLVVFHMFHLYEPHRKKRIYKELATMSAATLINFVMLFSGLYIFKSFDFSRRALFIFLVIKNVFLGGKRVALRLALRHARRFGFNQKHVLIVGNNAMARSCYEEIRRSPELGYRVHGYVSDSADWEDLPHLGCMDDLGAILEKTTLDEVFTCLDVESHQLLDHIMDLCEYNGVRFSFVPYYSQLMTASTRLDSLNGIPVLSMRKLPLDNFGNAFIKRAMDIVGSAILILLSSPIMAVVAVGVKLSSPGPIIFRQERIGYGKKPFYMFKFRSMRVNSEQTTGWTTDNDPRKTKFGSFIRKYSLDELPQFFNVLRGDMSLVGPRPEVPHFVQQFKGEIPLYLTRQQVRPGITGWAQVNGLRGDTSIPERVKYDRWYIANWSLWLDIEILFRTLFGGFKNSEVIVDSKAKKEENKVQ